MLLNSHPLPRLAVCTPRDVLSNTALRHDDCLEDTVIIDSLISRMTLAEKVGQLNHPKADPEQTTGAGAAVDDIDDLIRRGDVGSLSAGFRIPRLRELQRIAVEESPHGIPLLFTLEVSGIARPCAGSSSRACRTDSRHRRAIFLEAGESRAVTFRLGTADVGFLRTASLGVFEHVWGPGEFLVEVGPSSATPAAISVDWRGSRG